MSPSPDVAEIVKRLRDLGRSYITLSDPQSWELGQILPEAADALDRMKAELDASAKREEVLREVLAGLLSHDFAEECQECGIGHSSAWAKARAALSDGGTS